AYCQHCHKKRWGPKSAAPATTLADGNNSQFGPELSPGRPQTPQHEFATAPAINVHSRDRGLSFNTEPTTSLPRSVGGTYRMRTATTASTETLFASAATPRAATPSITMLTTLRDPPSKSHGSSKPSPSSLFTTTTYSTAYVPKKLNFNIPADICPRCNRRIYAAELVGILPHTRTLIMHSPSCWS
ncbi:hypothetical protein EV182_008431, partial [Spiromyces aspiralis]